MIYWQGINIGDWHFYEEIAHIKSAILFQFVACSMARGTKLPI